MQDVIDFRVNKMFVALKEIRLQEDEGAPFTAIREGTNFSKFQYSFLSFSKDWGLGFSNWGLNTPSGKRNFPMGD